MKKEPLSTLIGLMKKNDSEPELANRAFAEFYSRMGVKIIAICHRISWRFNSTTGIEIADDLTQESLIKFFLKIKSFDEKRYPDEKALICGILSWISRSAFQCYINIVRETIGRTKIDSEYSSAKKRKLEYSDQEEVLIDEDLIFIKPIGKKGIKINRDKILSAVNVLPPREKDIIMTSMLYYPYYLPSKEVTILADKYGVEKDYLRTLKKRALKKMKKAILDLTDKTCYSEIKELMVKKNEKKSINGTKS